MDGLLIIDKPEGMTSAAVVRVVKGRLHCKTGHLGTLDPFASGVLPLCVGAGTKIAQFLNAADKEYVGRIRLGSETDTGDPTGAATRATPVPPVSPTQLAETAAQLRGEILHTPPMYSAVKRHGTPLYKLARRGIVVERQPRWVRIDELQLTCLSEGVIGFRVGCSKGTYIRVLAQQIAAALGTVGHLEVLKRTRFGHFEIGNAVALESVEPASVPLIGLRQALRHLREIQLDAATARRAREGYEPALASLGLGECSEPTKLVGPRGELAAVVVPTGPGHWRYARVFAADGSAS